MVAKRSVKKLKMAGLLGKSILKMAGSERVNIIFYSGFFRLQT